MSAHAITIEEDSATETILLGLVYKPSWNASWVFPNAERFLQMYHPLKPIMLRVRHYPIDDFDM